MIRREYTFLLLIILGSIALNLLNCPPSDIFSDDKQIYKYVGLVIYKGGVPYRDVFDHKPPLIYFLHLFDWLASPWITWLLDTILVVFASLLFYWLCRKNKLGCPWFLPVIFNLLLRYSLVSFGNGMTREYTTVFLLIFFCVMEGNARYKYFILGVLSALTFWMQQDAMLTLGPFLIYAALVKENTFKFEIGKRLLSISSGFLAVTLPLLFYFESHHALPYLWKDAFLFNLNPPGNTVGLPEKIKSIKHALHESEFEMAFYTSVILGVASILLRNRKPFLLYMALLSLMLSFAGELISGRMAPGNAFIYYLLPFSATIPILIYVVFSESPVSFLQDDKAQKTFYVILSLTLILGTIRYAAGFRWNTVNGEIFSEVPEIRYLDSQNLSDYELYVIDDSNLIYLYNKYKILSPSPWIYDFFWNWSPDWDKDLNIFNSIVYDLGIHKTRFILDCSDARKGLRNELYVAQWQKYLQTNYTVIMNDSSDRKLWRIK